MGNNALWFFEKDTRMLCQKVVVAVLFVMLSFGSVFARTAGVVQLPYDSYQHWNACTQVGFKLKADLVFMELNTELPSGIPQYHTAEDWNGICGDNTDKGADLYAIADATVENARMDGKSGGWLLLRLSLPDATSRYILYEHIMDIANNPRTGQAFKATDAVYRGELVAHIGNGNGEWDYHLHLEMRRDNSLDLKQDPYYPTLSISTALKYSSPSLFIDDRRYAVPLSLSFDAWTELPFYLNAPSSTAFIEYQGERYSLSRASGMGLIYPYMSKSTAHGITTPISAKYCLKSAGRTQCILTLMGQF